MKLVQKHLLKGSREFELLDNEVRVRVKTPLTTKERFVTLAILNPEPVVNNGRLEFHSRVKCGPLLSLELDKPDPEAFNAFVSAVKDRALKEFNAFAGIRSMTDSDMR